MNSLNNGQARRLLGYPDDARLLIINADDFGMCHAVNEAVFQAFGRGVLPSTTLMVPCPWALHAMHFLADHPEIPFGVHLTAISDWVDYRWGPVSSRAKVPSLLDRDGYFNNFEQMQEFLAHANLSELELEFRSQIETVLEAGLKPTHLDWHSLRVSGRDNIIELMFRLAREYGLALRVSERAWIEKIQDLGLPTDDYHFLDSAELLAIEREANHVRQTDFDSLVSQEARGIIDAEGIILLDYRALQEVWRNS